MAKLLYNRIQHQKLVEILKCEPFLDYRLIQRIVFSPVSSVALNHKAKQAPMFSIFWPVKLAFGIVKFMLNMVVLATFALTITAMMGDKGWLWSLTTHFRMQYLGIQLFALAWMVISCCLSKKDNESVSAWTENRLTLGVLALFAGLNLMHILPYYLPSARPSTAELQVIKRPVKLMHFNLFGQLNHNTDSVIQAIRDENPDVIDLVEYTKRWQTTLEQSGILRRYPYRVAGRNNIALYSRLALKNAHLTFAAPGKKVANQANIIAQITIDQEPVTLLVAHPASPILPSHLSWLKQSFQTWAQERARLGQNLLVVGDLNTSPWSREFEVLTRQTGLRDSQLGYGLQPSWPMLLPFFGIRSTPTLLTNLLAIPIDHVLVSNRILVLSRKTGPFIGSDHLPVTVEIGIRPASYEAAQRYSSIPPGFKRVERKFTN